LFFFGAGLQMGGLRDELAALKAAHTVQCDALAAAQRALIRAEEAAAEAEANAQVNGERTAVCCCCLCCGGRLMDSSHVFWWRVDG
jgi:hypothetical protein